MKVMVNAKNMVKTMIINVDINNRKLVGNHFEPSIEIQKIILQKAQITTSDPTPFLLLGDLQCWV